MNPVITLKSSSVTLPAPGDDIVKQWRVSCCACPPARGQHTGAHHQRRCLQGGQRPVAQSAAPPSPAAELDVLAGNAASTA